MTTTNKSPYLAPAMLILPNDIATIWLEEPCPACERSGRVYCALWREWSVGFDAHMEATSMANPEWSARQDEYIKGHPFPECAEEHECGECDGTGYRLTREGMALAGFIHRHSRSRP